MKSDFRNKAACEFVSTSPHLMFFFAFRLFFQSFVMRCFCNCLFCYAGRGPSIDPSVAHAPLIRSVHPRQTHTGVTLSMCMWWWYFLHTKPRFQTGHAVGQRAPAFCIDWVPSLFFWGVPPFLHGSKGCGRRVFVTTISSSPQKLRSTR